MSVEPTTLALPAVPSTRKGKAAQAPDPATAPATDAIGDARRLLGLIFEHATTGLAIADTGGRLTRVNSAMCGILGYGEADLVGMDLSRIMTPHQGERLSSCMVKVLSGEQANAGLTIECLHPSGRVIRLSIGLAPVTGAGGTVENLLLEIKDCSLSPEVVRELEENRKWYRALSDATFEAVFISRKGICIDANQTASEMLQIPREELIGIFGTDVIAPEYKALVRRKMLSGNEEPYRAVAMKKDGTRFHVKIQGKMIRIGNRDVRVTVMRDIDARVKAEAALRESERHLRSLMESASNFVLFRLRHNEADACQPQPIFTSPSIGEIVDRNKVVDFQSWIKMIHPDDVERLLEAGRRLIDNHRLDETVRILDRSGKGWRWLHIISTAVAEEADNSLFFNGIILDITSEVQTTAALRARESELKQRTESLSEVNTALEVLLQKREVDRQEVEEKMLTNAKSLILPYLEKLRTSRLDDRQRTYLDLVESNLNELISPLSRRMSRHYLNFTPLEIQVANLVKAGKTTKDIARIMGLAIRTIEAVRYAIRRKLGLKKKRTNLRSCLLAIDGTDSLPLSEDWTE